MGRIEAIKPAVGADPALATSGQGFDAAHAAVAADRSLQFSMEVREVAPVKPPEPPPSWLSGLFEFLNALGPLLQIVFWILIALVVAGIVWFIIRELMRIRAPEKRGKTAKPAPEAWRPEAAAALALLSDADALAAKGQYAEAVHLLLLRSINDIEGRLPNAVRPALTSRDIARLERLPEAARPTFMRIARAVETSLFGGGAVDRAAWDDCRAAYEAFAFPETWTR
ncbi:DUF4129 domain-containing protein [Brevundimonas sp.]